MLADYDFVAIFDADFKPDADFLVSISLPHLLPKQLILNTAESRSQADSKVLHRNTIITALQSICANPGKCFAFDADHHCAAGDCSLLDR